MVIPGAFQFGFRGRGQPVGHRPGNLYYVEIIDGIAVTTKFTFVDGKLVEQSVHKMDFESREIKRLEKEVRRNRLRTFMKNSAD
ncbi:hypothetical protein SAMN05660226_01667 [Parapedobacter luteus]|uniref:Uncharacterized protein n=1 Tax=Parapedobacter luteus TaxID=623280 RepID=A0A1T5BQY2_9SPHI|nr:hypothetical protein SAMN05660226_01667 [Parapedobacter luteus]